MMDNAIREKIEKIKVLALDVDGVLTDGKIIVDNHGNEIKNFDVHDGLGMVLFRRAGYKIVVITARLSSAVDHRCRDLKVDKVYQDAYPKMGPYKQMIKDFGVSDEEVCFVGDDLPDLKVMTEAGFAVTVPNARDEIKKIADMVTKKEGGSGAVREVIELILKVHGKWEGIVDAA